MAIAETRILLLGDSLSASYGMTYEAGWVPQLQQKFDTAATSVEIINASISGETTGGGLSRLPRLLDEHSPDILWIELGGNDGLRGYPPPRIRQNLEQMTDLASERNITVWLTQIEIPPNYGPRYNERFSALFREVAESRSLELLPFILVDVALKPELMMNDGIHPTIEAQPLIAERFFDEVRKRMP